MVGEKAVILVVDYMLFLRESVWSDQM